jgi:hypothetical protein
MHEGEQTEVPKGSWTGIIIVILIIALGGAYYLYVKSGAMKELDKRNRELHNQGASPAALFEEFHAMGDVDVTSDVENLDKALK